MNCCSIRGGTVITCSGPERVTSTHPIGSGPIRCGGMCASNDGGVNCLICGRFDSNPASGDGRCSGSLHDTFRCFTSRRIGRFVLSLHCGGNKLLDYTRLLYAVLTPSSTLKRRLKCLRFGGHFGPRVMPFALGSKLVKGKTGLGLGALCMLADDRATSTSRVIVGYLSPCVSIIVVNNAAMNGGMNSEGFSDPRLVVAVGPVIYGVCGSRKGSSCRSKFRPTCSKCMIGRVDSVSHFLPFKSAGRTLLDATLNTVSKDVRPPTRRSAHSLEIAALTGSVRHQTDRTMHVGWGSG